MYEFCQLLVYRTHMQDLKDVTNNVHYENYRSRKLAAVTYNGVDNNKNKGQLTKLVCFLNTDTVHKHYQSVLFRCRSYCMFTVHEEDQCVLMCVVVMWIMIPHNSKRLKN